MRVTEQRTRRDRAECIEELVDVDCPAVTKIRLALGQPEDAQRRPPVRGNPARRGATTAGPAGDPSDPKHGSWLDMAESVVRIMNRQCLDRRIDDAGVVWSEVATWEGDRNERGRRIRGTLTLAAARLKSKQLYPSIEWLMGHWLEGSKRDEAIS